MNTVSEITVPEPWASNPRMAQAYRYGYANRVERVAGMTVSGSVCTDVTGATHLYSESGACRAGCLAAKKATK